MNEDGDQWLAAMPSPDLADVVSGYVAYRQVGHGPGLHTGLPSSSLTFVVAVGSPIEVVAGPVPGPQRFRGSIAGLATAPAIIRHDGHQEGVAIDLSPLGARSVLGVPASALRGTVVDLGDILGSAGVEMWERLQAPAPAPERVRICDDVLRRVVDGDVLMLIRPELRQAWTLLQSTDGRIRIGDLARRVGWSRQHLTRRFRAEFGVGPKDAARIIRFERSRRLLQHHGARGGLAELAAVCGFTDQSHLINEWQRLAGCTPVEWCRAEEVPFFQDGAPTDG